MRNKKEYAIKITNKNLGDFYYHYTKILWKDNYKYYVFSKKTIGVRKWKTIQYINTVIDEIFEKLLHRSPRSIILLECTDLFNEGIVKESEYNLLISRKKCFIQVTKVSSKNMIERTDLEISNYVSKITSLMKTAENDKILDLTVVKKMLDNLELKITSYNKYKKCDNANYQDYINNSIDYVDASYNFRLLKLKKLMNESR